VMKRSPRNRIFSATDNDRIMRGHRIIEGERDEFCPEPAWTQPGSASPSAAQASRCQLHEGLPGRFIPFRSRKSPGSQLELGSAAFIGRKPSATEWRKMVLARSRAVGENAPSPRTPSGATELGQREFSFAALRLDC